MTAADLEDRARYLNAKHTIEHLLSHAIIPVVNENDSVAIEELKFGDNDRLSALVAGLASADLLVILTDVDGLFTGDPHAKGSTLVDLVENIGDATPGTDRVLRFWWKVVMRMWNRARPATSLP